MNARRNLSLPVHGAIELAIGLAAMAAPAIFGFGPAGFVISFSLGAILVGISLNLTTERGLILVWHRNFDSLFVLGAAAAALVLAIAGDGPAGFFIATMVAAQAALHLGTRYTTAA
jgi:hypothetical protein